MKIQSPYHCNWYNNTKMEIQCPYWYNKYQSLQKFRITKIQKKAIFYHWIGTTIPRHKYSVLITVIVGKYIDTNTVLSPLLLVSLSLCWVYILLTLGVITCVRENTEVIKCPYHCLITIRINIKVDIYHLCWRML